MAIASNRPARFTHIILKYLKIGHAFDHVLCADSVTQPKPDAEMLNQILARSSLNPDEAVYVGDMTIDVKAGREAGIKTVAVVTGSSNREELASLKPFAIIDHVLETAQILEELDISGKPSKKNICC